MNYHTTSKATTHLAWPYLSWWTGKYHCSALKLAHDISYTSSDIRLFSIRSFSTSGETYDPYILQQASLKCPHNLRAKVDFNTSFIALEERHKLGDQNVCFDYVRIQSSTNSVCELCGNENIQAKCGNFLSRSLGNREQPIYITFRSGSAINKLGFRINIICSNAHQDVIAENCLDTSSSFSWEQYSQTKTAEVSIMFKCYIFHLCHSVFHTIQ